jgi:pyruvate kinase
MLGSRRVKIVATIGPASSSKEALEKAILAGMNVARLNFSHGEHKDHAAVIKHLRELSKQWDAPVAILQDLQGPKIRVGKFENGLITLKEKEKIRISVTNELGKPGFIPTDFEPLPGSVRPGSRVLLDDGLIELRVLSAKGKDVDCEVVYGGDLKDRKGMNIPGAHLPVDALTEKDLRDLQFGLLQNVDYVALSFVRRGEDMRRLRELVREKAPHTKIIAKIEMLEALDHLEEIITLSDGVMVARGDLAVEAGQTQLPAVQKRIIRLANQIRRPVITATQMLDSMVNNPRPTRAEITDVANAILDGSDALMLSAESASGKYPFKAIRTMHEIATEVEKTSDIYYHLSLQEESMEVPTAIAASACLTAMKINAKAIVCLSTTGKTAQLISSFRPKMPILAVTHHMDPLNRLELMWGIQNFRVRPYRTSEEVMEEIEDILLKLKLASTGDKVVITMGTPVHQGAKTNTVKVYTISGSEVETADKDLPLRYRKTEPAIS